MNFMVAVPPVVNCAVPRIWMSVQYAAVASQNFTSPGVTGVVPASTVAVRVTTLPEATVVTPAPPEVTDSVVLVVVVVVAAKAGNASRKSEHKKAFLAPILEWLQYPCKPGRLLMKRFSSAYPVAFLTDNK